MSKKLTVSSIRKTLIFVTLFALSSGLCFAQGQGATIVNGISNELNGMMQSFVTLLKIVLGIGALITLAMVIFNVLKGEREAAQKMAWWVVGLSVGFAMLSIIPNLVM